MKKKPMVSVKMLTYNHAKYIEEAIAGVLKQVVNFPIELIISDDCSTDNNQEIIKYYQNQYPEIIKPIFREKNIGAINNSFDTNKYLNCKYIALCEGDDYWTDPYKLQKQVDFLEENPEYVICHHGVKVLKDGELLNDTFLWNTEKETDIYTLAYGNYIRTPSVVFRSNISKNFPPQFKHTILGDHFMHMLNARQGKIYRMDNDMAVYRMHSSGIWSLGNLQQQKLAIINHFELLHEVFKDKDKKLLIILRSTFVRACLSVFYTELFKLHLKNAGKYLVKSFKFGIYRKHFSYPFEKLYIRINRVLL